MNERESVLVNKTDRNFEIWNMGNFQR